MGGRPVVLNTAKVLRGSAEEGKGASKSFESNVLYLPSKQNGLFISLLKSDKFYSAKCSESLP